MDVHRWKSPTARLSPLARRRTQLREDVYRHLLQTPSRFWTVPQLSEQLTAAGRPAGDGVRAILYVLLADHALATVPGHRTLTVALTSSGQAALTSLVATWTDHFSGCGVDAD